MDTYTKERDYSYAERHNSTLPVREKDSSTLRVREKDNAFAVRERQEGVCVRPFAWEDGFVVGYDGDREIVKREAEIIPENIVPYEWICIDGGVVANRAYSYPPSSPEKCVYWSSSERGVVGLIVGDGDEEGELVEFLLERMPYIKDVKEMVTYFARKCNVTRHFHYGESNPFGASVTNIDLMAYLDRFASGITDNSLERISETFFGKSVTDAYSKIYAMKVIDEEMGIYTGLLTICNIGHVFVEELLYSSDNGLLELLVGRNIEYLPLPSLPSYTGTVKSVSRYDYSPLIYESVYGLVDDHLMSLVQTLPTRLVCLLLYSDLFPESARESFEKALEELENVVEISRDWLFISGNYGYEGNIVEKELYDERTVGDDGVTVRKGRCVYTDSVPVLNAQKHSA